MSTTISRPIGNPTDPPNCCWFISNLFGFATPNVPVFGSEEAIAELTSAIDRDSLFIQPQGTPLPSDNIKIAYQHLQRKGVFPQAAQLQGLRELTPQAGLALGISPEDYVLDPADAVTATPPFKTLDVDRVLGALRAVAKYFNKSGNHAVENSQTHAYQVGIVTMTVEPDGGPLFQAQLFRSQHETPPNGTLWLYRWCVGDGAGSYHEKWRALGDGTFDMATVSDDVQQVLSPPLVNHTNKKRAHDTLNDADAGVEDQTVTTASDDQPQRSTKKQRRNLDPASVPDDALFTQDPESITGPIILRLASHYGNTELFERINDGLAAKQLPLVRSCNVITRRITLAIQSRAARSKELTVESVRKELNEAREKNGVRARMYAKTRVTKEANRAAEKGTVSGAAEYVED
ncbi:hypothetical protein LTR85_007915 [Meristemomyces frigidus]|nr:hypothetical protein LTR85_007915 [Meristemomyces frigidus]